MSRIKPTEVQTARRPMSYGCADDTGPCEGRQASPSNPTSAGKAPAKEPLTETFVFRCTASEKAQLRAKAEGAGLPASTLLREALGLTEARRRKPIPRVGLEGGKCPPNRYRDQPKSHRVWRRPSARAQVFVPQEDQNSL